MRSPSANGTLCLEKHYFGDSCSRFTRSQRRGFPPQPKARVSSVADGEVFDRSNPTLPAV